MKENGSGCLDTVGAVVVDLEGNVAAAVSSGGLAMKHPGRVGQVGLPLFMHISAWQISGLLLFNVSSYWIESTVNIL